MPLTRIDSAFLDLDAIGGIDFDVQSGVPTFSVDAANHRVGIGTASPGMLLHVKGSEQNLVKFESSHSDGPLAQYYNGSNQLGNIGNSKGSMSSTNLHFGIGSKSDLLFGTKPANGNSTIERLRITSDGELLIGHTVSRDIFKETQVQISGANGDKAGLSIYSTEDGTAGPNLILGHSRNGAAVENADILGDITFTGHDGTDINSRGPIIRSILNADATQNHLPADLVFYTTQAQDAQNNYLGYPTETLRITSSGNVGIGVDSPLQNLHIVDDTSANIYLHTHNLNTGSTAGVYFRTSDSTTADGFFKSAIVLEDDGTSWARGKLHILQNNTADSSNATLTDSVVTFEQSGKVGIGTSDPQGQLTVALNNNGLELNPGSAQAIVSYNRSTSAYKPIGLQGSTVGLYIGGVGERLHIDNTGRVGIANNAPTSALNVIGTISTGRNLARELGTVISWSSQYSNDRSASNIINGKKNQETGNSDWITTSNTRTNAYVVIDLGASKLVDRLVIYNQNEYSNSRREVKQFKLQGSNNNSSWTDVISDYCGKSESHEPNPGWSFRIPAHWEDDTEGATYRYWKIILLTFHGTDPYGGLMEVELYEGGNTLDDEVSTSSLTALDITSETASFGRGITVGKGFGGEFTESNGALIEGYVGCGTADPAVALDVNGTIQARASSASGGYTTYATRMYARLDSTHCSVIESYLNNSTAFEMMGSYADSGGSNPRIVLGSGGQKVGIGVTDPGTKLEVSGGQSQTANTFTDLFRIAANANNDSLNAEVQLNFGISPSHTAEANRKARIQSVTHGGTVTPLAINPDGGNVGIGTSSPNYKLEVNGSFAATTKSFIIDHPTKPGMKLRHGSLEGPENGVYVRGRSHLEVINLPDYWTGLIDPDSITVTLTPIGPSGAPRVERIENNKVYVFSEDSRPLDYFYMINAERVDVDPLEVEIPE